MALQKSCLQLRRTSHRREDAGWGWYLDIPCWSLFVLTSQKEMVFWRLCANSVDLGKLADWSGSFRYIN